MASNAALAVGAFQCIVFSLVGTAVPSPGIARPDRTRHTAWITRYSSNST